MQDEAAALIDAVVSLAAGALNDLAAAAGLAIPVDLTAATTALGVSGAATAGTAAYTIATGTLAAASSQLDAQVANSEAGITTFSDPGEAANAAGTLAALTTARGYVRRASANLANASS